MTISEELAALFHRDLTRLTQQIRAFTSQEAIWQCMPGVSNSAGNLTLHLEGNLRDFIGRVLGGTAYQRTRDLEFSATGIPAAELAARIDEVKELIPNVIRQLSETQLQANFPDCPLGPHTGAQQFLIHLYGHLNYHLGQIDYLRRILTEGTAIQYAQK